MLREAEAERVEHCEVKKDTFQLQSGPSPLKKQQTTEPRTELTCMRPHRKVYTPDRFSSSSSFKMNGPCSLRERGSERVREREREKGDWEREEAESEHRQSDQKPGPSSFPLESPNLSRSEGEFLDITIEGAAHLLAEPSTNADTHTSVGLPGRQASGSLTVSNSQLMIHSRWRQRRPRDLALAGMLEPWTPLSPWPMTLQRVVNSAQSITRTLPSIDSVYTSRCLGKVGSIIKDPSYPAYSLFQLLPSGRRYESLRTRTSSFKNSFFSAVTRLLNDPLMG
ncbi:uncharacterized protein LOC119950822 [Scyliorhinus canicula]|uniref:uncharacterized protein LOC119950822 n=1 Tax=Scyliorhinus canicula TaxID=7830 RepID=UPI0018F39D73|nr:uncharacterized protein LOC119950822 [Scyliorhinus canicula]